MGYTVGSSGESERIRHSVLEQVFQERIWLDGDANYLAEWGQPGTPKRLRKMAESIATFCRNAKNRSDSSMEIAIDDWESDLDWLEEKFYTSLMKFPWPSTE